MSPAVAALLKAEPDVFARERAVARVCTACRWTQASGLGLDYLCPVHRAELTAYFMARTEPPDPPHPADEVGLRNPASDWPDRGPWAGDDL